jgi:hypothetical protein
MCHATDFLFLGQFFRKEFNRELDFLDSLNKF